MSTQEQAVMKAKKLSMSIKEKVIANRIKDNTETSDCFLLDEIAESLYNFAMHSHCENDDDKLLCLLMLNAMKKFSLLADYTVEYNIEHKAGDLFHGIAMSIEDLQYADFGIDVDDEAEVYFKNKTLQVRY